MGLLTKAIGNIGLYASQKKSAAEYSGPCQMCGMSDSNLYAYDGKHLCRNCLDTYINDKPATKKNTVSQLKAERKAEDAKVNSMLQRISDAAEACNGAYDSVAAIDDYWDAVETARMSGLVNLSANHPLGVINECIKAGLHDKAWGYLNSMVISYPHLLPKIREQQARILKKEGRTEEAERILAIDKGKR